MKAMKMKSLVLFFCLIMASATAAWAADGASYVTETYADGTSVTGGTSFTKTWTIKNSGTTKWTSGYKLRYVSGNLSTSHTDIPISGTVSPGSSYKFSVTMKAPAAQSSAMSYREDWKFVNSSGTTIKVSGSSTIWASIKVPAVQLTDKAGWGSETIPDNTKITGGSGFNKTWTIKNSGTSTWTSSYKLQYVSNQGGRLSSISEVKISGTVYPGSSYTFTVPMKAPAAQTSEKTYREDWKFVSPSGGTINIGSSSIIWALIKVPGNSPPPATFILYPLSASLSIAENQAILSNPLGAQAFGGTHLGVDIMKAAGNSVYSIGDGIVTTNKTDNPNYSSTDLYGKYWNALLVVYYPSLNCYVHYGHLNSSLAVNSTVKRGDKLGTLRESYAKGNIRTPNNDHLHLGVNSKQVLVNWGYTTAGTSVTTLLSQGWRDPVKFMRGQ